LIERWQKEHTAIYDFKADDDIQHTVWVINDSDNIRQVTALFEEEVPLTYIADGHHRAASAAKVRAALGDTKKPGADYFLTTLFPSNQLHIMDYNRVIKDLNEHTVESLLEKLGKNFDIVQANEAVSPQSLHQFGMYVDGRWYTLSAKDGSYTSDPIGILDVTILQQNVLEPVFNIVDQRTDKRIDFVGGIRGLQELEKRVDSKEMAIAFSLYPESIQIGRAHV